MSEHEPNYPLASLYLYLTDYCNLSCGHCWISPRRSRTGQDGLPLEELERTIMEAKQLGLQSVKLTGGEPLLYRGLDRLLEFLSSEELTVYMETNGTLIHEDILGVLESCDVSQVSVSLDASHAGVHDEIRGVEGSFRRALKGVRLLADRGLNVQIIMTLQRKNREEVADLIHLSRDVGAKSLKINHLIPSGRARECFERGENLNLDELIELHRVVEERWAQESQLEIIFDLPALFQSISEIQRRGASECRILNILGVLANGDLSICGIGQTMDALRLGHISRVSVMDVWRQSSVLRGLRESLPRQLRGACGDCIFQFRCLGACRANAYAMTGDLYAPYFLCQELYDSGRFPPSRRIGQSVSA